MFKRSLLSSSIAVAIALSSHPLLAQAQDEEVIEEIVVTGLRASLTRALDVKRESFQIVDAIVAEDIGKFPDNNVVEALQRVTGVQVTDRGAGEVTTVSIRGLTDVTTTVNGRTIFTASGRSVALADIPASLLKQVDVYKTRSSNLIESGIAGQIDIKTHRPFDFDGSKFVVAARAIHQEQADKTDPNISALASNRWNTDAGELGALVNISYARTNYRDQSVTAGAMVPFMTDNPADLFTPYERIFLDKPGVAENPIWTPGLDEGLPFAPGSTLNINGIATEYLLSRDAIFASDFTGKRERPAANIAFQFAPSETSEYLFEAFYNGYRNESFNSLLFSFVDWWGTLDGKPAPVLFEGTNIIKERTIGAPYVFTSGDLTVGKTDSYIYTLGGNWDLSDNFKLQSELVYQTSEFESSFFAMRTDRVPENVWVDFNSGGGLPAFGFETNAGDSIDLTDPAGWNMANLYDNGNRNEGDAVTLTVDADYSFDQGFFKTLSFGLRYDDRSVSEAQRSQDAGACVGGCSMADFDGLAFINKDFFDGESDVPRTWTAANGYYIEANQDQFRTLYGLSAEALEKSFEIDEATLSLYIQADFETELAGRVLDGQIGLRYTGSETDMAFTDLNDPDRTVSFADADTSKVLPSVIVRYNITDDLIARASYSETLRRPDFVALNANINYFEDVTNIGYGTAGGGNPALKPTESKNYDLTLEWYFAPSSSLYATLFKREIEGFVIDFRRMVEFEGDNYVLSSPFNASNGKLDGLEIGLVYFPEDLPELLDGFGIQASYTALDSSQDIPQTDDAGNITGSISQPIFGVSDSSYSIVLAYDRGTFDARLSYVWRDDFLNNYEAALFANPRGICRKPETSLDLQISYDVTDDLTITLDGTNLTNEIYQSYYQYPSTHNFGSAIYSRTFAVGARYSF